MRAALLVALTGGLLGGNPVATAAPESPLTVLAQTEPNGVATGGETGAALEAPANKARSKGDWLTGGFDRRSRWITAGVALGLGAYYATADTDDIRDLGDITQFVPGVFGLGSALAIGDREGLRQLAYAAGTATAATHGIKYIVDKERPDGSADNSFPSGHTAASFTGAAYIWRRYGARWGAPASMLAAYTGASRVKGQKHFADDVISGMAIGLLSNFLHTHPIDERARLSLLASGDTVGLEIEFDPGARRGSDPEPLPTTVPHRYFVWEMGLFDMRRNAARAPSGSGTAIDFRFDENQNPIATGMLAVGTRFSERSRHGIYATFSPIEIREGTELAEDTSFAGEAFLAGTSVASRYVANDYWAGYGYDVVSSPRFTLTLSGSVAHIDTQLQLRSDTARASVEEKFTRLVLGARAQYAPGERWLLWGRLAGWSGSDVTLWDSSLQLGYRLTPQWALSAGLRFGEREIHRDALFNDTRYRQLSLGVWYLW
ncbi:MAG: phosphatase PAP2 family protein [Pseudomonadota bacterium]